MSEHLDRQLLAGCVSHANLRRAVITSVVVGPLLSAINQTSMVWRLLHGDVPRR